MSPCRNWDPPPPLPPERKGGGGGHTRLRVTGWRSPNSNDWRKGLALLSTLWVQISAASPLKYQNGQLSGFLDGHMYCNVLKQVQFLMDRTGAGRERRVPLLLLLLRRRGQVSSSDPSVQSYSPSHSWPRGTHSPSSRHVNSSRPHSSEQV